jgi:phosphate acyltransferase
LSDPQFSGKTVVAVDAMGGDFGPSVTIPALAMILRGRPDLHFLLFGDEVKIKPYLAKHPILNANVTLRHTDKTIKSDDKPSAILRSSKGTSMRLAIEAVEAGEARAVVSAGNTGALMALAKLILRPLAGIHRPAIASVMPGISRDTVMLDLGANVLVDGENLAQFAVLGSVFAKIHKKMDAKPLVGLLNVGSEETKGPEHVRAAAEILSRVDFPGQYFGFVEGDDIMKGTVDVIVCDGYAGNIALKTAEGVGKYMKAAFTESFKANPLAMLGGIFAYYPLKRLKKRMDPRLYNGGVFLGLNGLCIKSHGGTDALGFSSAVLLAVRLARQDYTSQISKEINHLMGQETFLSQNL